MKVKNIVMKKIKKKIEEMQSKVPTVKGRENNESEN